MTSILAWREMPTARNRPPVERANGSTGRDQPLQALRKRTRGVIVADVRRFFAALRPLRTVSERFADRTRRTSDRHRMCHTRLPQQCHTERSRSSTVRGWAARSQVALGSAHPAALSMEAFREALQSVSVEDDYRYMFDRIGCRRCRIGWW
jgi:hypothetical protein